MIDRQNINNINNENDDTNIVINKTNTESSTYIQKNLLVSVHRRCQNKNVIT